MPVSTIDGLLGTGTYFGAMIMLLVALLPSVGSGVQSASLVSAKGEAQGIASQIDSMHPGMKSVISLPSMVFVASSVSLSQGKVTARVGAASYSVSVEWTLNSAVLDAGRTYELVLNPGGVLFAQPY